MVDRRVQKTLLSLHQALITLILEKGYERITVKEIIDRANVGRSTFYAHYLGKDQLLQSGLDDLGKVLLTQQKATRAMANGPEIRLSFTLPFFEHAYQYKDVYRAMVGQYAGAMVAQRLQRVLATLVTEDIAALGPISSAQDVPTSALVQFIVGTIMSILTWWVDEPGDVSANEVEAMFRRLTASVIATAPRHTSTHNL